VKELADLITLGLAVYFGVLFVVGALALLLIVIHITRN
jgi:hypothetical protein